MSPQVQGSGSQGGRRVHYIPTAEQVHTLAASIGAWYAGIIYVAVGTGLRGGEIIGLEVDAIDFLRREPNVRQQLVCVTGKTPYLAAEDDTFGADCGAARGDREALARHLELLPPVEVEIGDRTNPRNPVRRTAKMVFTTGQGNVPVPGRAGRTSGSLLERWRASPRASACTVYGTTSRRR